MSETESPRELTVMEAIRARHSVRTFKHEEFTPEHATIVENIVQEANQIEVPFHTSGEVGIHAEGLGRMGFINGDNGWLILKVPKGLSEEETRKATIDASYRLHHCVIEMFRRNIASVWIAGTFSESQAEADTPGFIVPGGTPYGIASESPHMVVKLLFSFSNTSQRIPIEQLFDTVPEDKREFCEALRSAPSAMNKQPWRFVFEGNEIHLFNTTNTSYSNMDMGISLATMDMSARALGMNPHFLVKDEAPEAKMGGTYIMTCTL